MTVKLDFQVTKLQINVDIDKLRNYYSIVERDFQHLCWDVNKSKVNNGVGGHRAEKMYGWAIHSNALDLSKPCPPYNIGLMKSDEYRWTELDFGIIKEFKQAFPFAHGFSIATHPPGTFIDTHTDSDDWVKVHVPITTCDNSVFYFNDNEYHMEANGSMYLVNTTLPHGTNNRGVDTRAHLLFKIPYHMVAYIQDMKGVIG